MLIKNKCCLEVPKRFKKKCCLELPQRISEGSVLLGRRQGHKFHLFFKIRIVWKCLNAFKNKSCLEVPKRFKKTRVVWKCLSGSVKDLFCWGGGSGTNSISF
jgi:hypothetical protein